MYGLHKKITIDAIPGIDDPMYNPTLLPYGVYQTWTEVEGWRVFYGASGMGVTMNMHYLPRLEELLQKNEITETKWISEQQEVQLEVEHIQTSYEWLVDYCKTHHSGKIQGVKTNKRTMNEDKNEDVIIPEEEVEAMHEDQKKHVGDAEEQAEISQEKSEEENG